MRIYFIFPIICLQLLVLTHIAHTFVLLTANMEDVKKLAKKFVSDSLADKIAEFIAEATKNIGPDVFEENEGAGEEHQVSEENNMYNDEMEDDSDVQYNPKLPVKREREIKKEEKQEIASMAESQPLSAEQINTVDSDNIEQTEPRKYEPFPGRLEGPSRYVTVQPQTVKQYAYPLRIKKKPVARMEVEEDIYSKEEKPAKYFEDKVVSSSKATTSHYKNKYLPETKKSKPVIKGRPYRLLSKLDSFEDNEVTDAPSNTTDDIFSENKLFSLQKRTMDTAMTTRRAVYEFDQYDNKNYPISQFLATPRDSVFARKMINKETSKDAQDTTVVEQWWEKEMPKENDGNRKAWF